MFITTCVDYGETCDGHPRLLGKYDNKEEAEVDVLADMLGVARNYGSHAVVDENKKEVWASENEVGQKGSVWDIFDTDTV